MKKTGRLLAISLAIMIMALWTGAFAEGTSNRPDFSDKGYLLPIDFSVGPEVKEEHFTSEYTYDDSTLRIGISKGRYDDRCDYWVADIVVRDASQLRTAAAGGDFSRPAQKNGIRFAQVVNAVLAINGDFFGSAEKRGLSYTVRQGELFKDSLDVAGRWDTRLMDVLLIDEDGDFHVLHQPQAGDIDGTIDGKRILNSFCFGPGLVVDGEVVEDFQGSDIWIDMASEGGRQRMAICQAGPLHYKIIASSGNYNNAEMLPNTGLKLSEFAQLCAEEGVQTAYNLDGGDSAMLYFHGNRINDYKPISSVRKLQDVIYFVSAEGLE